MHAGSFYPSFVWSYYWPALMGIRLGWRFIAGVFVVAERCITAFLAVHNHLAKPRPILRPLW
jgi:hypothetical protein